MEEFDRYLYFEQTRRAAEVIYAKNPLDAENLTKWGGALLELSTAQSVDESKIMIIDAISKFDEALAIEPNRHEALWCMGNAQTSYAFLMSDRDEAKSYFDSAYTYFQKAINEDPENQLYQKSVLAAEKAPGLHAQLLQQNFNQHNMASGAGLGLSTSSNTRGLKSQKISDWTYDIFGWVILSVSIVAWVGFVKANVPPPQR